jgi:hypothetical protein
MWFGVFEGIPIGIDNGRGHIDAAEGGFTPNLLPSAALLPLSKPRGKCKRMMDTNGRERTKNGSNGSILLLFRAKTVAASNEAPERKGTAFLKSFVVLWFYKLDTFMMWLLRFALPSWKGFVGKACRKKKEKIFAPSRARSHFGCQHFNCDPWFVFAVLIFSLLHCTSTCCCSIFWFQVSIPLPFYCEVSSTAFRSKWTTMVG